MGEYTLIRSQDPPLIRVTARGRFDLSDWGSVAREARSTAAEARCNLLYDVRQATMFMSTADQYDWPRKLKSLDVDSPPRLAIVYLEDIHDVSFFETASQNMGQNVRAFTDYEEAEAWVTG